MIISFGNSGCSSHISHENEKRRKPAVIEAGKGNGFMKLQQISEHVYIYPPDDAKDRPMLGYVLGEKLSLAIDAGFSPEHVEEFYNAIQEKGFRLPDMTVITHWHWDHTLGTCAVKGSLIMNLITKRLTGEENGRLADRKYLKELKRRYSYIGEEFPGDVPLIKRPDEVFSDILVKDLGGVTTEMFYSEAPHTDDSTLIWVPEEKVLFVGDALYGDYFTGYTDRKKMAKLRSAMAAHESRYLLAGHQGLVW